MTAPSETLTCTEYGRWLPPGATMADIQNDCLDGLTASERLDLAAEARVVHSDRRVAWYACHDLGKYATNPRVFSKE